MGLRAESQCIHHLGYQRSPWAGASTYPLPPFSMTLPYILASSTGGGKGGKFFLYIYIYIHIHIYISSFKLLIVRLDYQNHSVALPAAGRPQPWFSPHSRLLLPFKPTMQPTRGPVGPTVQLCPVEAPAAPLGPMITSPFIIWGLPSPLFSPCCPHQALLPSSGRRKPKDLKVEVGEGFGLFPTPLFPCPLLLSPERRCSYQKRLLKDDLFYFSLTFPSLGKKKKKRQN